MRGRGAAHLLVLALCLVVACQAPLTHAGPTASSSVSVDSRVLAADGKLYSGDYDGAETAYRSLANTEVPGAAAHLSTLLAYENRFEEAVAEAQIGVALRADSDSLARLTRALDWSEDIDRALQAGARAVATKPVSPTAHVFYAEALADAGRFDDSARELRTAEDAGSGDAFLQAEIYREWSNYYRGRGDTESELNYTELAVKAQSALPERPLDLIRYDYDNQRQTQAQALTDKLLSTHGKSYSLIVAAADAALVGGDTSRASSLYLAAAQAQPGGAEAAVGQAELDVVVNRDFTGAHDVLLAELQRNPTSSQVYEFLRYLDLLALNKDAAATAAELNAVAPQRPAQVATDRKSAVDAVNSLRSALNLPALREDPALDEAAQAHAYFYLFNATQAQVSGTGLITEDSSLPGFTGAQAFDRDRHFGYTGARSAELADHVLTATGSVQSWVNSVFHRLTLADAAATAMGYGQARIGPIAVSVLDLGASAAAAGEPVVYPTDGQPTVPLAFTGTEVPDPLPQTAFPPSGYPVTLEVGDAQQLQLTTSRLLDADGKEVPSYTLAPGDMVGANEWALLPHQPLTPGAKYTVDVAGTVDGTAFSKRWSFTATSS